MPKTELIIPVTITLDKTSKLFHGKARLPSYQIGLARKSHAGTLRALQAAVFRELAQGLDVGLHKSQRLQTIKFVVKTD